MFYGTPLISALFTCRNIRSTITTKLELAEILVFRAIKIGSLSFIFRIRVDR
jgi:hypothetical protein